MPEVNVEIAGKKYRMACEEGQEGHLTELAARFDRYVMHLKSQFGEIGDLRLTVMAGIMVMDELSDVSRRLKAMETEVESLTRSRDSMLSASDKSDTLLVAALGELTNQINGIAQKINGG